MKTGWFALWLIASLMAAGCEGEATDGGAGAAGGAGPGGEGGMGAGGAAGGAGGDGGEAGNGGSGGVGGAPEVGTRVFVLSQNLGVASFVNAEQASGAVEAKTFLNAGPDTEMYGPRDLELDTAGTLYVASENDGSVVMYANAKEATGLVTPARRLAGGATGIVAPIALAIDRVGDELYVTNSGASGAVDTSIRVFPSAATVDGDVAPSRTIEPNVPSFSPISLTFANGSLYAVTQTTNSSAVLVFEGAAGASGLVTPTRTLSQASFGSAASVHVTAAGRVVVVDEAESVFIFEPGEVDPSVVFQIGGASGLSAIHALSNGAFLFADRSANVVFALDAGLPEAAGLVAPTRSFEAGEILLPGAIVSN